MEKKTIGGFIAALRKANGMTQRELAERLNVSDKTVSRWERDDGDPDLAVIPVIAEIFGVTCDELLRGERKSRTERCELMESTEPTPKGEKQLKRLLKSTLSDYQSRTYIAMGISVVGLIAAMIGNLAFLRAVLGFLLGAIFFTASTVCQALFIKQAFDRVDDTDINTTEISAFKLQVMRLGQRSFGLTVSFVGFTFPLIFVDAYVGLGLDNLLLFAIPGTLLFLGIFAVICYFVNADLLKRGVCTLEPKAEEIYWKNHKLKRSCAVGLVFALTATLTFHAFGSEVFWSTQSLVRGTTFNDYGSFVAYMEQDIQYDPYSDRVSGGDLGWFTTADEHAAEQIDPPGEIPLDKGTWYDEDGNAVSKDEALTRTLKDINGDVVCTFVHRNEAVTSYGYSPKDGTVLPITTYTNAEYRQASQKSSYITSAYCILYPIELLTAFLIYFRKRAK